MCRIWTNYNDSLYSFFFLKRSEMLCFCVQIRQYLLNNIISATDERIWKRWCPLMKRRMYISIVTSGKLWSLSTPIVKWREVCICMYVGMNTYNFSKGLFINSVNYKKKWYNTKRTSFLLCFSLITTIILLLYYIDYYITTRYYYF